MGTRVPVKKSLFDRGWGLLKNVDVLSIAEAEGFDAIVTTDQNLRDQQNLGRAGAVLVEDAAT